MRFSAILPWLLVIVVGPGVTIVALYLLRLHSLPISHQLASQAIETVPTHVRGPSNARLTIQQFGDFECPPCEQMSAVIKQMKTNACGTAIKCRYC
jgi:hypothetical protein